MERHEIKPLGSSVVWRKKIGIWGKIIQQFDATIVEKPNVFLLVKFTDNNLFKVTVMF